MPICISKWDFLICETFQSRRYRGCDIAAISPRRPVCDIALRCRRYIAKCSNLGSHLCRSYIAATFRVQCSNIAEYYVGDIAAMSPPRHRGDVATATSRRRRHRDIAAMSPWRPVCDIALRCRRYIAKCNNLGSHLCRSYIAATFANVAAI